MEAHIDFVPLLLVVVLAFIVPLALSRFRKVPVVVGEILAGVIIGGSGLGLVSGEESTLNLLSQIGFAFLMFLSGLEINFSVIFNASPDRSRQGPGLFTIGSSTLLITLILAGLIGGGFTQFGLARDPWMMALILSTTSLGIVVPVLKERGLSASFFGQAVLLASLMADFITMFLITVYVAIRSSGLTLDILLVSVLFVAFLVTYRLIRRIQRPSVRKIIEELSGATSQVKVRGAVALMMAFVVLAEFLSVELILGAFLAGAVASLLSTPQDDDLRHKLDALGFGFFVPLFFIVVGVRFDLQAFLADRSAWLLAPLLLIFAFLIKFVSALVFRFQFSWRETFAAGSLLSARLSLIIAASAIGLELGVISAATNAAIILIAALTSMFAPLIFNLVLPATEKEHERLMLIFGARDMGLQVARILRAHGERVKFLEPEVRQVDQARQAGFEVIHATTIVECLQAANEEDVHALLVLSSDDTRNLLVSRAAINLGIRHVVALVNDPAKLPDYRSLGVQTFAPVLYHPSLLALMARSPDILTLLTSTTDDQDVSDVYLRNPLGAGERLSTLGLPGNLLVLSVCRDDEMIIPHGNTRLEIGDRLTILGDHEHLQLATMWLESTDGR